jgi:hypothetical protein
LEHTRTSTGEQGATPATGDSPGIGAENTYDPTPDRTREPAQQSPGAAYEQPPPEPISVETAVEEEIMSKLPRKRPQRRSTRRTTAQGTARKTTARKGTAKKASAKRTSSARGSASKAKAKNAPNLPEQAVGAAISAARLPFRFGAGMARRANDLIGRIR